MKNRIILFILLMSHPASVMAQELRDIKGPVELPVNNMWLLALIVLIILAIGGLLWFCVRNRLAKSASIKPSNPPWVIAAQQLQELADRDLITQGMIKEYYFELSGILRQYIEARFHISAPEMTTEEFLVSLKSSPELATHQKQSLKEFLISCDMVKFAKFKPNPDDVQKSFHLVVKFVEETKMISAEMK